MILENNDRFIAHAQSEQRRWAIIESYWRGEISQERADEMLAYEEHLRWEKEAEIDAREAAS